MNRAYRFKEIREFCGLDQGAMADRVDVKRNTWGRYEAGDMPTGATLDKLAEMGFSVDWLLTGRGSMRGVAGEQVAPVAQDDPGMIVGRGEAILRGLPEYPIPDELQEAIDFIVSLLKKGPRNYPVARFNVMHLASLIDEMLNRSETDSKSDPTKTSMP
jgi:transcriptional regulator with XRE-family HTH domain